jgi:hypothetical protein
MKFFSNFLKFSPNPKRATVAELLEADLAELLKKYPTQPAIAVSAMRLAFWKGAFAMDHRLAEKIKENKWFG